jgi:hypothetical protein
MASFPSCGASSSNQKFLSNQAGKLIGKQF